MCGISQVQFAKMSSPRRLLSCLPVFILLSVQCTMPQSASPIEDTFRNCLMSQMPSDTGSLGHCLGVGAISKLQSLDNDPEFDLVDGLSLSKNQQKLREAYNFADRDPADLRTIVDSLSHIFSHRSMHWNMGFLYPGLAMRIAPSGSPGGVLEFVLDPQRESLSQHSLKEIGTGRLLARQFLLPFLLGFKFNVATIIPILFGLLAILAKKAIIISKIALVISSAYGLGTLLLGNGGGGEKYPTTATYGATTHGASFNPAFGGHYNRFPVEDEYQEILYRGMSADNAQKPNENLDQFKLYANLQEAYDRNDKAKGRNFAWSDDEKKKKSSR